MFAGREILAMAWHPNWHRRSLSSVTFRKKLLALVGARRGAPLRLILGIVFSQALETQSVADTWLVVEKKRVRKGLEVYA